MCRQVVIIVAVFCGNLSVSAQIVIADSLLAVGNYAEAISTYQKTENPAAQIYAKIGSAYKAVGNTTRALKNYKEAVQKNGDLILAKVQYAKLLRQTHHLEKADSLFSGLVKRFPDNPGFHYQLGLVRVQNKDSTAIAQFQHVLQLNPNHQKALYHCAYYNYQKRNFDAAEVLGRQALKINPGNIGIRRLMAKNAYAAGNYKLASARFEKLVRRDGAKSSDFKMLGFSYYRLQDIDKAISAFKTVVKRDKHNLEGYYNLGLLYNLKGDFDKAINYLQASIYYKKQGLGKQYQTLGLAFKGEKDYRKAMMYFKLALKENPKLYRAQYELANCADNYFKDLKTRLNYYKIVVKKFEKTPKAAPLVELSKNRISDLTREIHLGKE